MRDFKVGRLEVVMQGEYLRPMIQDMKLGERYKIGSTDGPLIARNHWFFIIWGKDRKIGQELGRVVVFKTHKQDKGVIQDIKLGEHFRVANYTGKMILKVPGRYLMLRDKE